MYDFANSGYTTVVITAVFNAYFVAAVAGGAPWATFAWTAALAVSYALIVLTAPVIGAYADTHAAKKRLLVFTTMGCVVFTAGLAAVGRGDLGLGVALVILSNFFFGTGENLIAAFLPEIAQGEALGRVSGWGWSLGYFGGIVTLGACLAYVTHAQAQGATAAEFVPVTMLITAGVFLLASLPTFLFLRERAVPVAGAGDILKSAFARVAGTLGHARRYADLWRFLTCLVFYQAGIQTVIALAAVYAQEVMGFTTRDTIVLILVVNLTAAAGAFVFGQVQDRLGHVRTLAVTLIGWILTVLLAWAAEGPALFWVAANLVGVCLGSSQSAGRALVGYLSPPARTAEFFGLWGLAVKLSSILGPLTYGAVTWATQGNHRLAILATGLFFVIGLAILAGLDTARGRTAALKAEG
ncbi:MAG: MFS transporter [Betaproteobacteria bacterium RIFCSPLOWO2_02_FULL_67_26]|nr:MAG: MFS transporter [Betaproteobacteria bacterium RIFCSPLOWO2_02_FULL_67_26]